MKVLIAFLTFSALLYSFTLATNYENDLDVSTFKLEDVVSTETLDDVENLNISVALDYIEVSDAKIFTMKNGETFLEYTTTKNGKVSQYMTIGFSELMVPPCHCGPGSDGIFNNWWEGRTPYRYTKPYCLPCAVDTKVDKN